MILYKYKEVITLARKKMTVYVEEEAIKNAKKFALDNDISLSDIVDTLLQNMELEVVKDKVTIYEICRRKQEKK